MSAYARYPSLQDRGVPITGGATGIGEILVTAFAEQGAKVAVIDLAGDDGHALAARRLARSRHASRFETADFSNLEALRAANDKRHIVEDTTPGFWDAGVGVNLKQGGMPVYTTSKAAVQGLTRSLARDFGPFNIRVNTLVPGWVMTEKQICLWLDDKGKEEIARGQCINQPLLPEHIARMALFLAADDSAMCTAQDFIVDGGWV